MFFLSTALVAACGGYDASEPVDVDATVDAGNSVTVPIKGDRAAFLAARVGQDPWQRLTADASGDVALAVDRPFEMVGVCPDFGGVVYAYAGGVEDANLGPYAYDIGCGELAAEVVPLTVRYTGPGSVYVSLGYEQIPLDAEDAPQVIEVQAGVHDVMIVDRVGHQIAVRRGVTITRDMVLTVDLTGAVAMVPHPVEGAPAGATVRSTYYTATGARATLARGETTGWTVPASLAATGDRHAISLVDSDATLPRSRARTVYVEPASTAPISISLPPHITSATLTWARVPSAAYVATGDWSEVDLFGYQSDAASPLWFAVNYPHAAQAAGTITAPDATGMAGWNAAWSADPTRPLYMSVDLSRKLADGSREFVSWWREDELPEDPEDPEMPGAKAARAARADRVERLRADRF